MEPTPWAVICPEHGRMYLTGAQHLAQLNEPDEPWHCPTCNAPAEWDDDCLETNPDVAVCPRCNGTGKLPDLADVISRFAGATNAGQVERALQFGQQQTHLIGRSALEAPDERLIIVQALDEARKRVRK